MNSKNKANKPEICFIVGSFRKKSFNLATANQVERILGDRAKVNYLNYEDLPLINQDKEYPAPLPVQRIRKAVTSADGIWIFTPEYNGSYPGLLKNLIDWLSRPLVERDPAKVTAIKGKKITVTSTTGGSLGVKTREYLFALLENISANYLSHPQTAIRITKEAYISDKLEYTQEDLANLEAQARAFLDFLALP